MKIPNKREKIDKEEPGEFKVKLTEMDEEERQAFLTIEFMGSGLNI